MVDLADGGVLGQQQAVPLADLRDVAQEQQAAGDLRAVARGAEHGDAAGQERGVLGLLELLDHRGVGLERVTHGAVVEAQLGQAHADRVGADPHPMQGRHGVGRAEQHPRIGIQHERAVAHPGRCRRVRHGPAKREQPLGNHRREPAEQADVRAFQFARLAAAAATPLPREHGDDIVAATHRDGHQVHGLGHGLHRDLVFTDLAGGHRPVQHGPLGVRFGADIVHRVDGGAGGRAHLRQRQPSAVARGHVQEQVGEGQVGEHAPLADEPLEVIDLLASEGRVLPSEFAEGGHTPTSVPRQRAATAIHLPRGHP